MYSKVLIEQIVDRIVEEILNKKLNVLFVVKNEYRIEECEEEYIKENRFYGYTIDLINKEIELIGKAWNKEDYCRNKFYGDIRGIGGFFVDEYWKLEEKFNIDFDIIIMIYNRKAYTDKLERNYSLYILDNKHIDNQEIKEVLKLMNKKVSSAIPTNLNKYKIKRK